MATMWASQIFRQRMIPLRFCGTSVSGRAHCNGRSVITRLAPLIERRAAVRPSGVGSPSVLRRQHNWHRLVRSPGPSIHSRFLWIPSDTEANDRDTPVSNWNAANALTGLRLAAAPVTAALILREHFDYALVTVASAGLTDALDGWVARHYRLQTNLGSYMDPLADKVLVACTFTALAMKGIVPVWLLSLAVARDASLVVATGVHRSRRSTVPWYRFWAAEGLPPLTVQPLFISKVNTALQVGVTIAGVTYAGGFGLVTGEMFHVGCVVTGCTTIASSIGYVRQFRALSAQKEMSDDDPKRGEPGA